MTKYCPRRVSLSVGQKSKQNNSPITIRLAKNELNGVDELMLTKTLINKIKKAMRDRNGVDIKMSKTQIRKAVKYGVSVGIVSKFSCCYLWLYH